MAKGNSDFYVVFGSNAKEFADDATTELGRVDRQVKQIGEVLRVLRASVKGTNTELSKALQGIAEFDTSKMGGGSPGGGHIDPGFKAINADLASISAEISNLVGSISRAAVELRKGLGYSAGRTEGARQRFESGKGGWFQGGEGPDRGKLIKSSGLTTEQIRERHPGAYQMNSEEHLARKSGKIGDAQSSQLIRALGNAEGAIDKQTHAIQHITAVPQGVVDAAGADRIVNAVRQVEQAVRAIGSRAGIVPAADLDKGVVNPSKRTSHRERVEKAEGELAAETELSTRQMRRRENRRKATEDRENRRQEALARLNVVGTDEGAFRSKIGRGKIEKGELVEIAKTFSAQGYETGNVSKKLTVDELVKRILGASRAYHDAGQATKTLDPAGRRAPVPLALGTTVKNMLGGLVDLFQHEQTQAARDIRRRDLVGGGELPEATQRSIIGTHGSIQGIPPGMVKGRRVYGAHSGISKEIYEAAVDGADRILDQVNGHVRDQVARHAKSAVFNPYDAGLGKEITGNDAAAKQARSALSAMRRATSELDDLGELYLRGVQQAKIEAKRLGLEATFKAPGYAEGLAARRGPREEYEANLRARPASYEERIALSQGSAHTLAGARTHQGSKYDITKLIPGLRLDPKGDGFQFGDQTANPEKSRAISNAHSAYVTATQQLANARRSLAAQTEIDKLEKKQEAAAHKFLGRTFGSLGVAPPIQTLLDSSHDELGYNADLGYAPRRVREPVDPGHIAAEQDRRLAIEKREAANAQKKLSKGEQLAQQEVAVAQAEKELADVTKQAKAAATREVTAKRKLEEAENGLVSALSKEQQAALKEAQASLAAAEKSQRQLGGQLDTVYASKVKGRFPAGDPRSGQYRNPYNRDDLGYDAGLGYGGLSKEAAQTETLLAGITAARKKEIAARDRIATIVGESNTKERAAAQRASSSAAELAAKRNDLAKTLEGQRARLEQLRSDPDSQYVPASQVKGVATTKAAKTAQVRTAEEQAEYDATLAKRRQLADRNTKLKAERDALPSLVGLDEAGRDDRSKKLRSLRRRINKLDKDIAQLDEMLDSIGSSGGSGGGTPPTARGRGAGSGGGDAKGILGQILAAVNRVNDTLKGGIKVTGSLKGVGEVGQAEGTSRTARRTVPAGEAQAIRTARDLQKQHDAEIAASGQASERTRALLAAAQVRAEQARRAQQDRIDRAQKPGGGFDIGAAQEAARKEQERLAAATVKGALAQQTFKNAMDQLSPATRREVDLLHKLSAEGASNARIAEQMSVAYRSLAGDLRGANVNDIKSVGRTVLSTPGRPVGQGLADDLQKNARLGGIGAIKEVENAAQGMGAAMGQHGPWGQALTGMFGTGGFWARVMHTTGTFVVRNFAAGFVFGLTNAFQQVVAEAIEAESTFIRVSSALEATGKSTNNIRGDLQNISTEYGVALNDVYATAASLVGIFKNEDDLAAGTKIVAQMQAISRGALSATEATGVLAATMSAFQARAGDDFSSGKFIEGGLEGATKINDVLTSIQNNLGVNIETTSEGVSRMAGLAREMKFSFEQTAVFTAQIAKQTNQTGAAAGEQFSRILGALQTGRGRAVTIEAFGDPAEVALNEGDYGAVFETIITGWDGLTDAQRRNVSVTLAGQRQAAAFNALVNDSTSTMNALRKAEDAHGDAQERMDKILDTLNSRLAQFNSQLQTLASQLVQSGLLDFFGVLLVVTTNILDIINDVLTAFNHLADNNSFIGFLRQAIALLLGFGLAFKAVQVGSRGLRNALEAHRITDVDAARSQTGPRHRLGYSADADRIQSEPRPRHRGPRSYGDWRASGTVDPATGQRDLSNVRRGGYLTSALGFGLDRTVGVATETSARGLAKSLEYASGKVKPFGQEVGTARTRVANFLTQQAGQIRTGGTGVRTGIGYIGQGGLVTQGAARFGDRIGDRLVAAAERQAAQAASLRQAVAGQIHAGSFGGRALEQYRTDFRSRLVAGGLSEKEAERRVSASRPALLRQARALEALSAASSGAAKTTSGLAGGFDKVAASGLTADAAMVGVTLALTSLFSAMERHKSLAEDYERAYQSRFGEGKGKTEAEKVGDYVGPSSDLQKKQLDELKSAARSPGFGDASRIFGEILRTRDSKAGLEAAGSIPWSVASAALPGVSFGSPFGSGNIEKRVQQMYGLEPGPDGLQPVGQAIADAIIERAEKDLEGIVDAERQGLDQAAVEIGGFVALPEGGETAPRKSVSVEAIAALREKYKKEIERKAEEIREDEDLSEEGKIAATAALEKASQSIQNTISNLEAIARGAASSTRLTGDAIIRLNEIVSVAQATAGLNGSFGVDLDALFGALIDDAGVGDLGPKMNRIIDTLTSPRSDSVDILIANRELLAQEILELQIGWEEKVAQGLPDEANAIRSQLLSVLQQYGNATDAIVDGILDTGTLLADQANALGHNKEAINITLNSLDRAEAAINKARRRDKGFTKLPKVDLSGFQPKQTLEELEAFEKKYPTANVGRAQVGESFEEYARRKRQEQILRRPPVIPKPAILGSAQSLLNPGAAIQAQQKYAEAQARQEARLSQYRYDPRLAQPIPSGLKPQQANRINKALDQRRRDLAAGIRSSDQISRTLTQFAAYIDSHLAGGLFRFNVPGGGKGEKQRIAKQRATLVAKFRAFVEQQIAFYTQAARLEIANAASSAMRAGMQARLDREILGFYSDLDKGKGVPELGIPDDKAANYGNEAIDRSTKNEAAITAAESATAAAETAKSDASTARQDAAALKQARLGVAAAYAEARGDTVAAAKIQVTIAAASIAAARADMAAATSASEASAAKVALYSAQAAMIGARAAVAEAQADLVRSRFDVAIALAEAAGQTVKVARKQLAQAQASLRFALAKSKGEGTAEVNAARAEVIRARAAARDAVLQDRLDTIDFNLQMGKITQSSAIAALREILKTADLTRQQRRDLLLKIKGMKDELANSQWNFGDIKLPTPYQMRRYITQRRAQLKNSLDAAAGGSDPKPFGGSYAGATGGFEAGAAPRTVINETHNVDIQIDGADTAKVRRILTDILGTSSNVTTSSPRRR